jgi:hypothetical protein
MSKIKKPVKGNAVWKRVKKIAKKRERDYNKFMDKVTEVNYYNE